MDEDIRIKDLPLVEDGIQSNDYIAVDNEDDGTRKATIQDVMEANVSGLETEATNTKGAINELFNKASKTVSLTQAEYDALPASKLSDDIAYFITDGEPDVDNALWTKVGRATLDTQAQNCSEAINEIKQSLSNLGSLIKTSTVNITINSGSTTGSAQCKDASNVDIVRSRFIGTILCKNDDVYYNPITFSVYQSGLIEARAFTAPTANRTYQIIVRYF